jgi:hypothetical protein
MTTKQPTLDAKLDAIAAAVRDLLPEMQAAFTDAQKNGQHQRHAALHRAHRAGYDFYLVASEPRT